MVSEVNVAVCAEAEPAIAKTRAANRMAANLVIVLVVFLDAEEQSEQ